ncbi:MAG: histidine kinase [Myxococcales bacterium]|nr:histidine kinase [Myxococcales bacterium]
MSRGLLEETIAALVAPRRLIPIVLVCTPLVVAQRSFSRDPMALPLGVAMCLTFALLAPYLWRRLAGRGLAAMALYGLLGAIVVLLFGVAIPWALGMGQTFLTGRETLTVSITLFWVGGWGLGRDIELEAQLTRAQARAEALEREAERAQLLALRSHLDPHFLFNTLNAIAEWCREDGEVAERAILKLSAILRTILAGVKLDRWPLRRELALARDLFELHLFRDAGLFTLEWRVPEEAWLDDQVVVPMILLPLCENAVKHGPAAGHRGPLQLEIRRDGDAWRLTLENPGPWTGPREGGEGLPMVRRRLDLAYGAGAKLTLAGDGARTRAEVTMPIETAAGGPVA